MKIIKKKLLLKITNIQKKRIVKRYARPSHHIKSISILHQRDVSYNWALKKKKNAYGTMNRYRYRHAFIHIYYNHAST